jgi:hypothetical protein
MKHPKPLYKTTIVIWSEYDPQVGIDYLARDAMQGEAYCSKQKSVAVQDPTLDPDWDGTEFFSTFDDDEEEEDDD